MLLKRQNFTEISMKNKKLVFLDIDGTLINKNYSSNYPNLKKLISSLQKRGFIFAINSNRSLEDLLPISKQFGIKGPLVGENGAFVYSPETKKTICLLNKVEKDRTKKTVEKVKKEIVDYGRKCLNLDNILVLKTDTVKALSNPPRFIEKNNLGGSSKKSLLLLENTYRRFTASLYLKKIGKNRFIYPGKYLKKTIKHLEKVFSKQKSVTITFSNTYGNILIYSNNVSKRAAIEYLKNVSYKGYSFSAIGDEINDFKMIENLGDFYTTNNSPRNVKDRAIFFSRKPFTHGVYEVLNYLYKNA